MSALQLYRGPRIQLLFRRRLGSPNSVAMMLDQQMVMLAQPSDFIALHAWLDAQAKALKEFMAEPDDPRVAENMRGDLPE